MESEATCREDGTVIFAVKGQGGYATGLRMGLRETKEGGSGDGLDGRRCDGFNGAKVAENAVGKLDEALLGFT
jgi:hypothetical protein